MQGDGGNTEGPETAYVDETPPPYCSNISAWEQAKYQPTLTGLPTVTLQNDSFCPDAQPPYSAFRDPSFGHGKAVVVGCSPALGLHRLGWPERACTACLSPSNPHALPAGLLVIRNATAAEWSWQRNQDGQATPMDRVTVSRSEECTPAAAAAAPDGQRTGSGAAGTSMGSMLAAVLAGFAAAGLILHC